MQAWGVTAYAGYYLGLVLAGRQVWRWLRGSR